MNIAPILLPINLPYPLSYQLSAEAPYGAVVKANCRGKDYFGIVGKQEDSSTPATNKFKEATLVSEIPSLRQDLLKLISWQANYYMAAPGMCLALSLNQPLITQVIKHYEELKSLPTDKFLGSIHLASLNETQEELWQGIQQQLYQGFKLSLIEGVTGSGKTELYCYAITDILDKIPESQVLVMLPEIALTSQLVSRLEQRLGGAVTLWHSGLTPKQRRHNWWKIATNKAKVILGARSSIMLPFHSLKLIIVDEEHDLSYKQEEGVHYHGRDSAIMRAKFADIPIILGSATPSLEILAQCERGNGKLFKLGSRFGQAKRAEITLVDRRKHQQTQPTKQKKSASQWLAPELLQAMQSHLDLGHQVMLFLNRRGYAPLLLCGECGYRWQCGSCSAWLVSYRREHLLKCHQCGYYEPIPETCPNCESHKLIACGPGVERLAEEVQQFFPNAKQSIFTRDTVQNFKQAKELVAQVTEGHTDIIIGTQLITKGYHFPKLQLVGVIDYDLGASQGDLRANERTWQLLEQVSGRAGRESEKGEVIIQTYHPEDPVLQALVNNNRQEFLRYELGLRKQGEWPPYGRIAAIIVSCKREDLGERFAAELATHILYNEDITIYGPAQAPIYQIREYYRWRFLLKTSRRFPIQTYIQTWLSNCNIPSGIEVSIDIDPYNFA